MDEQNLPRRDIVRLLSERSGERVLIRESDAGIGIYNPVQRQWATVLFLAFWLCGWSLGEKFALDQLIGPGFRLGPHLFMIIWIIPWTLGGAAVVLAILWQLFGVEKLFIAGGAIVEENGVGPFVRRRVHPLEIVSRVRVRPEAAQTQLIGLLAKGRVAFDAAGREVTFGIDMPEQDAHRVAEIIRASLPLTGADETEE